MCSYLRADLLDIALFTRVFRVQRIFFVISTSQIIANPDFLLIRHARQMHGHAGDFAFGIGDKIQEGVRADWGVNFVAFTYENSHDPTQNNSNKCNPACHKYCLIFS